MAKTRHQPEPTNSRMPMLIMAVGGLLVTGLVVWALTRTIEPSTEPAPASVADTTTLPAASTQPITATSLPSDLPTSLPTTTAAAATATVAPPQPHGDRTNIKRIAVEDLRAKMNRNEVTVVDVRDAASFAAGHITGAINVPFASVESMLDVIPKGKPIITYCT